LLDRVLVRYSCFFFFVFLLLITLILVKKSAEFNLLPGFNHLSGLIGLIAVTFMIVLLLYKPQVLVLFHGSMFSLFLFAVIIYLFLDWSWVKLIKGDSK